jgi:glycosyltransferase involved in cell wall biosynthesis
MRSRPPARVVFLPFWTASNPYQVELAQALGERGTRVEGAAERTLFLGEVLRRRAEVLHLHWLSPLLRGPRGPGGLRRLFQVGAVAVQLALLRAAGVRIVWTAHNLAGHEARDPGIERLCAALVARLAHRVIVHGPRARDLLVQRLGLRSAAKLAVVPHGSYLGVYPEGAEGKAARERLGLGAGDFVFLFLGQLRPYKGLVELVRAFRGLEEPQLRLVIAGLASSAAVERELRSASAGDARILLRPGFVPDAELQEYFAAADVAVLPYEDILTSGSLVLAMSFGVACLGPRLGCIEDYLEGRGGFLYEPDGPDALRGALAEALRRADALPAMGAFNREKVAGYAWPRIARETLEAYAEGASG